MWRMAYACMFVNVNITSVQIAVILFYYFLFENNCLNYRLNSRGKARGGDREIEYGANIK